MCKAKELSNNLLFLLDQIEKECKNYTKNYSQHDLMIEDILHKIEFDKFNAYEGYMLCKQLQNIRQERRIIKDELEPLQSLKNTIQNSNIRKTLERAKNNVVRIEKFKQSRIYRPKVLKNLSFK